nr:MAG TPA: YlbE-like protein [Caudoviricetes sp.]
MSRQSLASLLHTRGASSPLRFSILIRFINQNPYWCASRWCETIKL